MTPERCSAQALRTQVKFDRRRRLAEAAISVSWAATSPSDGRFSAVRLKTTPDQLRNRFTELRARGQGYLEIGVSAQEFPQLLMGFRGKHAVIHLQDGPQSMALLRGDGSLPSEDLVDVPIMDDLAAFTGEFVLSLDHAWQVVEDFMRSGTVVGEWCPL
jgi:hypothetical protein